MCFLLFGVEAGVFLMPIPPRVGGNAGRCLSFGHLGPGGAGAGPGPGLGGAAAYGTAPVVP